VGGKGKGIMLTSVSSWDASLDGRKAAGRRQGNDNAEVDSSRSFPFSSLLY
jgi:hypothetical protein